VNKAKCPIFSPTQRDGPYRYDGNCGAMPNYLPNSFINAKPLPKWKEHRERLNTSPDIDRHDSSEEDDFSQVGDFWQKVLSEEERERLVQNIAGHLKDALLFIQERAVNNFEQAHKEFGHRLRAALKKHGSKL